jgi:hypothetical protein
VTRQELYLKQACDGVGLQIDFGFEVTCPDGYVVKSVAHIRDVGDVHGMLVFSRYEEMMGRSECLSSLGYGYTSYGEPGDKEVFDLESYKQMFRDWGWTELRAE